MRIAVFFVGNRLMLDDGIGPAVYDFILEQYNLPENVDMFDVGCMTLDMVSKVNDYDLLITVDAVDGTDAEPGTVFRYEPYDIARAAGARTSLHELKLAALFDAATMMGYVFTATLFAGFFAAFFAVYSYRFTPCANHDRSWSQQV